jgi:NAD-dependent SIR2 family protein deacetylase
LSCPEELFEASFFNEDPRPFYKFARNLYFPQGDDVQIMPSDSHRLLALLDQKKMLRRCYTQNIDGLEEVAGVSSKKIVCAHGTLRSATCCKCKRKIDSIEIEDDIRKGTVAYCQAPCTDNKSNRLNNSTVRGGNTSNVSSNFFAISSRASSRKRPRQLSQSIHPPSHNIAIDGSGAKVCGGVMKPNITFFGESLGMNVKRCLEADRDKVDALIVIGTSV